MAFADDWGKYASAYSKVAPGGINDHVSTPNLMRSQKMEFFSREPLSVLLPVRPAEALFCPDSIFGDATRASILQGAIWDMSIPAYPLLLEESGYRIGHTYKVWSPGSPSQCTSWWRPRSFNRHGSKFNGFSQSAMRNPDREAGKQALLEEVRKNVRSFLDGDNERADGDHPSAIGLDRPIVIANGLPAVAKNCGESIRIRLKGRLPPFLPDVPVVREDFCRLSGGSTSVRCRIGSHHR